MIQPLKSGVFDHRRPAALVFKAMLLMALTASQHVASAQPRQQAEQAPASEPAAARLNELGPENGATARSVGSWDVTETVWDRAGAVPHVTTGLIAEHRMIGSMLEETLRSNTDPTKILRADYLTFNRVERRWEYVSMETRAPVGMMTAQSYRRDRDDHILIVFQPFAIAGPEQTVTGQMLRMRQEIISQGPDRQSKDQYFTPADGATDEWLAHRYAYVRRP